MSSAVFKPSSVELKQLSSLKHELILVESQLATCTFNDVGYYQNVKAYIEDRIHSIQSRI